MDAKDPYAQNKAETIAAKLAEKAEPPTQAVAFKGGLYAVLETVRLLQHRCGFPEREYQVKFTGSVNALRLSDYHTRAVAEPGQFFWLWCGVIMSGDLDEHKQCELIYRYANSQTTEPLVEDQFTAQLWSIMLALKAKRNG